MKRCPVCKKDYYDETLEFCLDDGSRLQRAEETKYGTLTSTTNKPDIEVTQAKTVHIETQKGNRIFETAKTEVLSNQQASDKTEKIKKNVANTTSKVLEISPIVLALAHNYWQWLYLSRQPTYDLVAFFTSYSFLVWLFLLFSGLIFGLFSLKYGNNKGFAITTLVVLAINVILSIVPR